MSLLETVPSVLNVLSLSVFLTGHRSPLREASPPLSNPRRGMDSWKPSSPVVPSTSKRKNRNDRLSSPNPKVSARREPDSYVPHDDDNASSENRKGDSYVPADTIPQRRGREQDYMDVEVKRRRTDVEISPPIRRSALPESALPSPSSSLPPHAASSQEIEVPRAFDALPLRPTIFTVHVLVVLHRSQTTATSTSKYPVQRSFKIPTAPCGLCTKYSPYSSSWAGRKNPEWSK